jgi:hypothetical protein
VHGKPTHARDRVKQRQAGQCQMALDQGERIRRAARKLGANTAARRTDDSEALNRCTYDEHRLSDNRGVCRGTSGTAEMHAQVAMSVVMPTVAEAVRRIGAQCYDQREGRDKRDQTITVQTRAQGEESPANRRVSVACRPPGGNSHDAAGGPVPLDSSVCGIMPHHKMPVTKAFVGNPLLVTVFRRSS